MKDREFNRLPIENTDGQIHAGNEAAHAVKELPLHTVSEQQKVQESFRANETGLDKREPERDFISSPREKEESSVQTEIRRSTVNLVTTTTVATPIVAALAVVVSAAVVVTSLFNSLSVKVALRVSTAFSLIFSLVIENPDEVPLYAILSADGQRDIVRPLEPDDTELVFENLEPETTYTLKILKIVSGDDGKEDRETLFEKSYQTEPGEKPQEAPPQSDPVNYRVTEEEWNAALASDRFENVIVRFVSSYREPGRTDEQQESEQTESVFANGYVVYVSGDYIEFAEVDAEDPLYESLSVVKKLSTEGPAYAEFTYDPSSKLYRCSLQTDGGDQAQETTVTEYAVGFRDGMLVSVVEEKTQSYGEEESWSSICRYTFEQYQTAFISIVEEDGVAYFTSSLNSTLYACKRTGEEASEVVIPASVNGVAVTRILDEVFNGSQVLSSVSLPDSLTSLGHNFWNCYSLETIYYAGTSEQWEELRNNSDIPENLEVICTGEMNPIEPNPTGGG